MADQDIYDPYAQSDYAALATYQQPTAAPAAYNPPLSAADQYRLQYGSLPFYGDTTHRSTYQRIELPPKDTSSQSFYGGGTQFSLGDQSNFADPAPRQAGEEPLGRQISDGLYPDDSISNRENSNVSDYPYANVPFYGDTTNRSAYTKKAPQPRETFKPKRPNVPYERGSIDQDEYEPSDVGSTASSTYQYSDVPFYGDTTSRTHFTHKSIDRVSNFKRSDEIPYAQSRPSSSSSTVTTHRSEYGPKHGERSFSYKPRSRSILSSAVSAPELDTTNRLEYAPKSMERTRSYKPRDKKLWNGENFDDQSTHRSEYAPKKVEKTRNYKPKDDKLWNGEAFDNLTTNRSVYDPKELSGRSTSFRPKQSRLTPSEEIPLEHETTNRSIYGPKPLGPRPDAFRPKQLNLGNGERMDNESLSRAEYVPKHAERAKAFKPATSVGFVQGPMQATSVSGQDYKPWGVQVRLSCRVWM